MQRALLSFAILLATACASAPRQEPIDLILVNGKVFTGDDAKPWGEAIAIRGDRIAAVGTTAEIRAMASVTSRVIDLRGRTVVPGINDAHVHAPSITTGVDLDIPNDALADNILARIGSLASKRPVGTWLTGDVPVPLVDDPALTRIALDQAAPAHPVILGLPGGHAYLLNSAALRAWNVSDDDGWLYEHAAWQKLAEMREKKSDEELVTAMRAFANEAIRYGITSVQAMPLQDAGRLQRLEAQVNVPLRWRWIDFQMGTVEMNPDRAVKYIFDGTPFERGAAISAPYTDRPSQRGTLNYSDEQIAQIVNVAAQSPHQLLVHAVGDAAIAKLITAMARTGIDWTEKRVRLEHGDFISRFAEEAKTYGIVLVQNPSHFMIADVMAARYGASRMRNAGAFRTMMDRDVPVAIGSDGPLNPWLNVMFATMHPTNPNERITREAAVVAYTAGSAYAEMKEDEKGTIAPGKLADLAVLSQDVFAVPAEQLPATQAVIVIIGGNVVFE